jgi:hypothetical protein
MAANRIFLVCQHHPEMDQALLLAERGGNDVGYDPAKYKHADTFFEKHAHCGRGLDHFQIAYNRPQDWDVPQPAENTVAGGVKLVLAEGNA